jgi:hypothetical protein
MEYFIVFELMPLREAMFEARSMSLGSFTKLQSLVIFVSSVGLAGISRP